MDLKCILLHLHGQKRRLDEVIKNLESLNDLNSTSLTLKSTKRRGRKQMPEAERKIVAERMRKYWADRKKKK